VRLRTDGPVPIHNNEISSVAWQICTSRFAVVQLYWEIFIMKLENRVFVTLPALVLASLLGACAGMTHQEQGTATGAVVGGATGAVLGGGVLGTAAGAVVGGAIGHEVTKPKR
jgi:osmotically inducible lipoprotein OsmB